MQGRKRAFFLSFFRNDLYTRQPRGEGVRGLVSKFCPVERKRNGERAWLKERETEKPKPLNVKFLRKFLKDRETDVKDRSGRF